MFDAVLIDLVGQRLLRDGVEHPLEPKAFAVLALLASSPGHVFSRDEILDVVWGHRHNTPGVLNRVMSLLRQALGEDAQSRHPGMSTGQSVSVQPEHPCCGNTFFSAKLRRWNTAVYTIPMDWCRRQHIALIDSPPAHISVLTRESHMSTGTVKLHRVLRAPPDRVYRAFLDADAMAKWLPPHGFTGRVHHLDAKVGGSYKMSFTNFSTGSSHSFGGEYQELVPNEKLRYSDKFDDPNLPGAMMTTITLTKVFCGTELNVMQEGIPAVIPVQACYLGWQESLTLLAQLVEAEIPDQM